MISRGNSQCNSMTNVFQSLLLVIAGATQKELARQVKYLKVENEILRSKSPKRITITAKEKHRLVRFARKLGGNLPPHTSRKRLVATAQSRWWVEHS
jgi:hypothetical protein